MDAQGAAQGLGFPITPHQLPVTAPTLNFLVSVRKTLGPETLSSSWRWLFSHNLPPSEGTWLLPLSSNAFSLSKLQFSQAEGRC